MLENNDLEGTSGIYLLNYRGDFTAAETVRVVATGAEIDGRKSDGRGGFLDFNKRVHRRDGSSESGFRIVQFLQMDKVQNVPGMEVAWNEVINEPGKSRVEDNVNIYKSSGTAASPLRIHDNYIQGAFTIRPWQGNTGDSTWDYDWGLLRRRSDAWRRPCGHSLRGRRIRRRGGESGRGHDEPRHRRRRGP